MASRSKDNVGNLFTQTSPGFFRNVTAIAGKELRVYLTTWTAYIVFAAFIELTAFFFYLLVREYQLRNLRYTEMRSMLMLQQMNVTDLIMAPMFSYVATFLIFMLPILTMRLFAEEHRAGTFELLMTLPLRPIEIVVGKFLAAWVMLLVMVGLCLMFPVGLHLFADSTSGGPLLDWPTMATATLGLILLGSVGVAVGLFASSITQSQMIAVVVAFSVLLTLMVVGVAAHGQTAGWAEILRHLSLSHHLEPFTRGVLRSTGVVYYLSMSLLALMLTYRAVETRSWR